MTGWDIDVAGVRGVLSRSGTAAKSLSETGSAMQGNLQEAASAAGTLTSDYGPYTSTVGVVGAALGEFLQHWGRDLVYIAERTSRSLNGAAEATGHYLQGDLQLASNAQKQAAKEPKVDLPGAGGHGHRRAEGQ
ncbi:DUF6507 family protein [Streptomyces sp. Li-HN-5-11]|uniref:DUF6507 family protein n=1 Tax=Streptomyces sp. Li-HN-5-11 TaxID=3075432 RepID=UPI0028AB6EC2|nr:DUF6507 family protein [Streptomyces sp. Li-HN-5-11]WNM29212.1 DUF6507 family protein [Streptomyces sp. Li-HN-5-11]